MPSPDNAGGRFCYPVGVLIYALSILGCSGEPEPTRPHVLYLREALPQDGSTFPRINPEQWDLGSLSREPPAGDEVRFCGDVVAFASDQSLFKEPLYVDEILVRVWWRSGTGRGRFALWIPDIEGDIGATFEAACERPEGNPRMVSGMHLTTFRADVERTLSPEQLAQLHLLIDVAGASVAVGSCSGQASMLILNPPSQTTLSGWDSDGDGRSDLDELSGITNPLIADLDAARCPPLDEFPAPLTSGVAPLPETEPLPSVLPSAALTGQYHHTGWLEVRAPLVLDGATLIFHPDEEGRAGIEVHPGGSLTVNAARLAAGDPGRGFAIHSHLGSTITMRDAVVDHPGTLTVSNAGRVDQQGMRLQSDDVTITGTVFRHGLSVLQLGGARPRVEGCTFLGNGTSVMVSGEGARIHNNTSEHDGNFVFIDHSARDVQITGNHILRSIDRSIFIKDGAEGVTVEGNTINLSRYGVVNAGASDTHYVGNTIRYCRDPFLPAEPSPEITTTNNHLEYGGVDCN